MSSVTWTAAELRRWLSTWLAGRLRVGEERIEGDQPMAGLGLRSLDFVELSGELEELLDRAVPPVTVYGAPTLNALVAELSGDPEPPVNSAARPVQLAETDRQDHDADADADAVAVVGLGLRLPGQASTPEVFWDLLHHGRDAVTPLPAARRALLPEPPARSAAGSTGWPGGYLTEDLAAFDAGFFGLSAREAAATDPQQRLMLETGWEALERAGIPPRSLLGSDTGVFVGASSSDYGSLQMGDLAAIDAWSGTGSALSVIANRISYVLGLRGPSLVVDTACSSSLVAVHQAMRSLRSGECGLALAGGVSLLLSQAVTVNFEDAGVMAADGRCKTFSADADGYVRGEGCGIVVLKRLADARRDGDPVLAVLRGSAVNQDGLSNGLMAPNPVAQEELIRTALRDASLTPDDIDYVEAHGTGTALGDPIEVEALSAALLRERPRERDLLLGSVKTNIGHLEAAAGIAGLCKVVLSLLHEELPPNLHFTTPNPLIPFDREPLRVVTRPTPWKSTDRPRRAGVSSFGFGGTNAHVVVEEAPRTESPTAAPEPSPGTPGARSGPYLLPLSAGSPPALRYHAGRLADWLSGAGADVPLPDIAYTLTHRRSHERHRLAVLASDHDDLREQLRAHAVGPAVGATEGAGTAEAARAPVWVFSGQGSQWPGMGPELLAAGPAFGRVVDQLEPVVREESGFSLRAQLESGELPLGIDRLQPLLFAVQVGLAELWHDLGLRPAAVIGHSMGEVAAAVVCGALSPEDGARVICRRSRLMREVSGGGAMAFVEQPADEVARRIAAEVPHGTVNVAVIPSPHSTVISGAAADVAGLVAAYEADDVTARLVRVDVASHSPQVDPLLPALAEALAGLEPRAPQLPFHSTVGGRDGRPPTFDGEYWADNLRRPVLLTDAVRSAAAAGHTWFVEVSPHPVLTRDVRATLASAGLPHALVQPTLVRDQGARERLLLALAQAYRHGSPPPLPATPAGHLVTLPTQTWERRHHWTAARPPTAARRGPGAYEAGAAASPLLGPRAEIAALADVRLWEPDLGSAALRALREHRVGGRSLLPLSAYAALGLAAAYEAGLTAPALRDLTVHRPVRLDRPGVRLQVLLRTGTADATGAQLEFHSREESAPDWTYAASARLHQDPYGLPSGHAGRAGEAPGERPEERRFPVAAGAHYTAMAAAGLDYGSPLRALERLRPGDGEVWAETVALPSDDAVRVLDAAFQALPASLTAPTGDLIVDRVDSVSRLPDAGGDGPLHVRVAAEQTRTGALATLEWYRSGRLVAVARGVRLRPSGAPETLPEDWVRRLRWQPEPLPEKTSGHPDPGPVLVVADSGGVGAALAGALRAAGVDCELVGPGDRPEPPRPVRHVVHCGALGIDGPRAEAPDAATELALDAVRWAAAPGPDGEEGDTGPRLWFVTDRAQAVDTGRTLHPAQSVLWGIGRCAALEHPDRWGGLIDLDLGTGDDPAERWSEDSPSVVAAARHLLAELSAGPAGRQSAYRDGRRWAPRLVADPRPLPAVAATVPGDGCHLVVGGTGRLGPLLLDRLVGLGARDLVLVSRRGAVGDAARTVERLRERGVRVTDVAASVTDEAAMRALFARFGTELPPLRGVYQAAFTEDVTPLSGMTEERLRAVLDPKVTGTALLHTLASGHDVEVFVCCSSTTGLLGSQGLAHYAAASCYQDALAHARRRSGLAGAVVNWGAWYDGLDDPDARDAIAATGMRLMPGRQAVLALDRLVDGAEDQLVVADVDWPALADTYAARTPVPLLADLDTEPPHPDAKPTATADGPTDGPTDRPALEEYVRSQVAHVLSLPGPGAVDPAASLHSYGLDSLMTMTLVRRLRALAPGFSPAVFRENPTVSALTDVVFQMMTKERTHAADGV